MNSLSLSKPNILIGANIVLLALLLFTATVARNFTTWILEIFPIVIALPILIFTYKRFPFTNIVYVFIFVHALLLMTGGVYSYAKVPLGFYVEDLFNLSRNPYDKLGHFFQGFVPALIAREILVRKQYVRGKKMLAFVVICIILAISATYELIEWAAALILGQGADEFLGTQGDQWDTQSDMFFALLGAIFSLVFLASVQDKQILSLSSHQPQA